MIQNVEVPGIGPVTIARRRGMRTIRISVAQNGVVKLSLPFSVSLKKGLDFLHDKKDWIAKHTVEPLALDDGAMLGKQATLYLHTGSGQKIKSVRKTNELHVYIPEGMMHDDVQKKLQTSTKKILIEQSQNLLLPRLQEFAKQGGYTVKSGTIALLKSRWGSCSSHNDIVLNGYLIQLPWNCIDYVIWHELAHTKHHNHSDSFWSEVAKHVPNYKDLRKKLKTYPTSVFDGREFSA